MQSMKSVCVKVRTNTVKCFGSLFFCFIVELHAEIIAQNRSCVRGGDIENQMDE
jgi:hypothetical protein